MSESNTIEAAEGAGTELTRFNALRHGVLSRYTVLPWEDGDEYRGLVESLAAEHHRKGRPRSTWSRNSRALFGARGDRGWPKRQLIGEDWRSPLRRIVRQQRSH